MSNYDHNHESYLDADPEYDESMYVTIRCPRCGWTGVADLQLNLAAGKRELMHHFAENPRCRPAPR